MYSTILEQLKSVNIIKENGGINSRVKTILPKAPYLEQMVIDATSFLDFETDFTTRLRCISMNIQTRPECKSIDCNNQVPFNTSSFREFCCTKCSNSDKTKQSKMTDTKHERYGDKLEVLQVKRRKTNLERYGVEYAQSLEYVKQKQKNTNLERYGVEVVLQNEYFKQKQKQTNLKKYGVEYTLQDPNIRKRIVATNLEKYGTISTLQSTQSLEKIKQTNLRKRGVEHHMQCDNVKLKMRERYFEKHNVEHPLQNRVNREQIVLTNYIKYGVGHFSQIHIKPHYLQLLNDKQWLIDKHHTEKLSMAAISQQVGFVDPTTVSRHVRKLGIEVKYYYHSSTGHLQIVDFIESLGIKTESNNRTLVAPKEIDIVIPEHSLAIEFCGLYWHSEQKGRGGHYHSDKMLKCQKQGIRLLTIFDDEWNDKRDIVKSMLRNRLGIKDDTKTYARNTTIQAINTQQKRDFFNSYHIQGDGPGSICYGLINPTNNQLVACMAFIKAPDGLFYLNRYATSHNVPGGFSKLLKHFKTNHEFNQIVSFADLRWSEGDTYFNNGFTLDKILAPDYAYSMDGHSRIHKFNFRHKNLPNLLHNYDPNLSERENCDNNGLLRLWDCGKMRFLIVNR
jgi:hypothetical protein